MKDYDIYLKQHIHEAEVLIYSLPYRDGITVTNRIILEAMLKYYTLQKAIAIQNQSEIIAEIDKIILTIQEKVGSGLEIQSRVDLFKQAKAELEQISLELNIPDLPTLLWSFFEVENILELRVSDVEAHVSSMLGRIENQIALVSNEPTSILHTFANMNSGLVLQAEVEETFKQGFDEVSNDIEILASDLNLLYCFLIGGESMIEIMAKITDTLITSYLNGVENNIVISAAERASAAKKSIDISTSVSLFCEMAATVIYYFQSNSSFTLSVNASAGLKRFRRLEEIDELTLGELDNKTLNELDFVEIVG